MRALYLKEGGAASTGLCLREGVLFQHRGGERSLSHTEVGGLHPSPSRGAVFPRRPPPSADPSLGERLRREGQVQALLRTPLSKSTPT